ncbi:MAG TPA: carboxypeptidase regulatory-like domain-containing protein [Pyrinomonadaceae bacterium]|nr:carboxypeptidase regulatory-like domain-containing protein [Pyrinomonadaceae bacterium]
MSLRQRLVQLGLLLMLFVSPVSAQRQTGELRGRVLDQLGGLIVGATVTATEQATGSAKTTASTENGNFSFTGLPPGKYQVQAQMTGFGDYVNKEVNIAVGPATILDIQLIVAGRADQVAVGIDKGLNIDEQNRTDATVLKGQDLEALPDDPDELAAALQALAGPAVGPNGGQLLIDGFEGTGRVPPRSSIREIRINDNPLSAERDVPSFGGIQIITRPGTEQFHGAAYTSFMDESLNARNPFSPTRAPFQIRQFGGNLSGTIRPKRDSYFIDFERNETDDNDLINATVLNPVTFLPEPFISPVLTPTRNTTFSPRFDLQINPNHTLITRYSYLRTTNDNLGVGGFSLPSRAYEVTRTQHTFQLTETAILNPTTLNEFRFQFIRGRRDQRGDDSIPGINVQESFFSGGPQIGLTSLKETRFDLINTTTMTRNNHVIRLGGRLRGVHIDSVFRNNFAGTFVFGGALAPTLQFDSNNQVVRDENGNPVLGPIVPITSIERYRRTLLLEGQGFTPTQLSLLGAGPSQFTIDGGDPNADVSQIDYAAFIQDEWRVRPNFTLNLGLRYEGQTNIGSPVNFAPRIFFAWAPEVGANQQPITVIRGGFGIFYNRFSEFFTLDSRHFNGINILDFIVTDPTILNQAVFTPDGVSNVPPIESLASSQRFTRRIVPDNLQATYSYTVGLLVERQLPKRFILSAGYINNIPRHSLRSRNINAPLPGTFIPAIPGSGVFPLGNVGPIYAFESGAVQTVNQLQMGLQNRFLRYLSFSANYTYARATSNTGGPNAFPANSYDLTTEMGPSDFEIRHRFAFTGTITVPKINLLLNPIILANSGRPFNIITGRDNNGDGLFTDRPSFATSNTLAADLRRTRFGDFDINPLDREIIPRNFGRGPAFFSVNIRVSRQFKIGPMPRPAAAPAAGAQRRPNPERPYTLVFSASFQNLFNRTNLALPVGNLSSPSFGESLSSLSGGFGGTGSAAAGNRRIQVSVRFNF